MVVLTLDTHLSLTLGTVRTNVQTRSSSSIFSWNPQLHKLGLLCFIMQLVM